MNPEKADREAEYDRWKFSRWPGGRVSMSTPDERGRIPPKPVGQRPPLGMRQLRRIGPVQRLESSKIPLPVRSGGVPLSGWAERRITKIDNTWTPGQKDVSHKPAPYGPVVQAAREAYFRKYGRYPKPHFMKERI